MEKSGNVEDYCNNREYMNIICDILKNKNFLSLEKCKHHGINRLEHSMRVSFYSYCIAKKLKLNYIETARGGLLHDFFHVEELTPKKQKFCFAVHPYQSLDNASNNFSLSALEKDIIINHMFPTLPHKIPKYMESWLVCFVDKAVAMYEFYCSYGRSKVYKFANIYLALLLVRQ